MARSRTLPQPSFLLPPPSPSPSPSPTEQTRQAQQRSVCSAHSVPTLPTLPVLPEGPPDLAGPRGCLDPQRAADHSRHLLCAWCWAGTPELPLVLTALSLALEVGLWSLFRRGSKAGVLEPGSIGFKSLPLPSAQESQGLAQYFFLAFATGTPTLREGDLLTVSQSVC